MKTLRQYRCIIFDMDGTLTKTNQLIFDAFNVLAEKYLGKTLTPAEIVSYFGPPEEDAVRKMLGARYSRDVMREYYEFYHRHHDELASLYPGIRSLLKMLQEQKVLIGLFTGKGRTATDISLREFGIDQYFDVTISGNDVDSFKPSGDGILKIMKRFSLDPADVLMVGDSVADIKAAREAGVEIASVVWDSYGKDEVMKYSSDFVFHDVGEFSRWLQEVYRIQRMTE